jgi:hypothetical protein
MEPAGPVAAQLEEIIEVCQPRVLELSDEVGNRIAACGVNGTDGDEIVRHSKLVSGQAKSFVDRGTRQPAGFVRSATNEQGGRACRDEQRHGADPVNSRMQYTDPMRSGRSHRVVLVRSFE